MLNHFTNAPVYKYKMVGLNGLEPSTSRLSGVRSNQLSYKPSSLWQPPALPHRLQCSTIGRPGLNRRVRYGYGCVPGTHRHQISSSYSAFPLVLPLFSRNTQNQTVPMFPLLFLFPRKEVIQPHLPIRLPCYDFTPVTGSTFGSSLL